MREFVLPCDNTFSLQIRVTFFFYNPKIWNMQYFNEIKYVGIPLKYKNNSISNNKKIAHLASRRAYNSIGEKQ